jgi:hypothetical protein
MPLITPKKVMFSPIVMERMWSYVEEQVDYLLMESESFRTNKLPEWTRLLKGRPKQETKNFPFPDASNLVVQLIATRVEQMLSRAMVIYSVDPLWTISALGDLTGQEADDQANMLQQFMSDQAIDPDELGLYRKEELMFHDGIAYGTAFMGFPWQYITEHEAIEIPGSGNSTVNRPMEFKEFVKKDGPSPENIPLDRILISNQCTELEKCKFFARVVHLSREAVEDRIAFGVWSKEMGEKVLSNPSTITKNTQVDGKEIYPTGNKWGDVYKVYECYFKFVHDKKTFSICAHWHRESQGKLSATFNYFPKNMLPFEDLRFGYDDDQYYGYGFIEMLQGYQQEVSTVHNNRLDNEAIRNNVTFRINKDSELASSLKFFPGVGIPADQNEVEVLDTRGGSMDNIQSEQAAISMANERSGIDPAISGNGGGVVNSKRGIYSSQGTMAVLQQQNNRTGLRMMDIRGTHVKIGRKLLEMYAHLGIGSRLGRYGKQAESLRKALDSVKAGNLGLILKASSASTNVESDRQNSILLQGLQEKYISTVGQLMQAMQQPQVSPDQKQYFEDVLFAENSLTRHIFRIFGHFDVDKLVPFPENIKNERFQRQQQQAAANTGNQTNSSGVVPITSGRESNSVPTSQNEPQAS